MTTNPQFLALILAAQVLLVARSLCDVPFPIGIEKEIEFVAPAPNQLPPSYSFTVAIEQGERLRFILKPVGGASLMTEFGVYVDGQGSEFEASGRAESQDWTMGKVPPGRRVRVDLRAFQAGRASLTVLKVGGTKGTEVGPTNFPVTGVAQDSANAWMSKVEKRLDGLDRDIAEIKRLLKELRR